MIGTGPADFPEIPGMVQSVPDGMIGHPDGWHRHSTAIVDMGAVIGRGTVIWHFSHVMAATIGEDCSLGQGAFVAQGVRVGSRCKIQNNVSLYSGVTLEDDVFLGPSCVFTNVRFPRCGHPKRREEYEKTLVRKGATVGANATIRCGVTIGEYAMVGAGAVVTRDVRPYTLVVGVPARCVGRILEDGRPVPGQTQT